MKFHPLADLFPLMEGAEFDELAASIKANGLREAITLFDDAILDGRNRYRACEKVSVKPRFEDFTGGDPHAFVADKNLRRRHLNETQRAMIAGRMANMEEGRPKKTTEISVVSISGKKAASVMNVSDDLVSFAKTVIKHGTPEEIKAVEAGKIAVSTVARQIRSNVPSTKRQYDGRNSAAVMRGQGRSRDKAKMNSQMWGNLRDALTAITSLPKPADVVMVAKAWDRSGLVDARLFRSIQWLKEFSHEWSKRNEAADQESGTDNHADTGTGD